MRYCCNSWHVRNLPVIVLRLNKSLKLAEGIVTLHPHQAAQAQHQLSSHSAVYTARLVCRRQCQRRFLAIAPSPHPKRCLPLTAGDFNISNVTILNTFKLHARRNCLFAERPDTLNLPSVMSSTLGKMQSSHGTHFPTSNRFKSRQARNLNHLHLLWPGPNHTPPLSLRCVIASQCNLTATLRVALRQTYNRIPTDYVWRMKKTNIRSVESRRRVWWRTMATCWRQKTPLRLSRSFETGMPSRSLQQACQMIGLSGSWNYTLSMIWAGMSINNALSNTGVETSSKAWDARCGTQPMPSISFMPFGFASTAIRHRNSSIPQCSLQTGGGRN